MADPAEGRYPLLAVVHPDLRELPVNQSVWQTDSTFLGIDQAPAREHLLHLFATDSSGSYRLVYDTSGGGNVESRAVGADFLLLPGVGYRAFSPSGGTMLRLSCN